MKNFLVIFVGFLFVCFAGISKAATVSPSIPVYTNDFESGVGNIQNVQRTSTEGYSSHGFGNYYGWSAATESNAITLQLNGLPEHSYLKIEFDLAIIDSWDGDNDGYYYDPDYFNVKVDETSIFTETFSNFDINDQSYDGEAIVWKENLAKNGFGDSAYRISLVLPHTSDTAKITWFASGSGWEGGWNESYAIDNVTVTANPVPIPAAAWLLGSGLVGLVAMRRRFGKV